MNLDGQDESVRCSLQSVGRMFDPAGLPVSTWKQLSLLYKIISPFNRVHHTRLNLALLHSTSPPNSTHIPDQTRSHYTSPPSPCPIIPPPRFSTSATSPSLYPASNTQPGLSSTLRTAISTGAAATAGLNGQGTRAIAPSATIHVAVGVRNLKPPNWFLECSLLAACI